MLSAPKRFIAHLYNNQIEARALIGQSAMAYCAGKLMKKSCIFWIIYQHPARFISL